LIDREKKGRRPHAAQTFPLHADFMPEKSGAEMRGPVIIVFTPCRSRVAARYVETRPFRQCRRARFFGIGRSDSQHA
jgi:hypothetical protein